MKGALKDLQKQLQGEIFDTPDALDYFSTDGSIFTIRPKAIVYPRNAQDVSATVKYALERTAIGERTGVTARGKGTDQGGGALGDSLMLVFPAHMNRLIELTRDKVVLEPGLLYKDLQNTLHTHGRFLPPYPSSIDYSTLGGAVANNASGEKTIKYGSTRKYIEKLEVVLADGSIIETKRLNAHQLNRKKGLNTFEGEIYRRLDGLLKDNSELIKNHKLATSKNSAGYDLWDVRGKDGSFDLSQIIAGSQGTLGVVTQITFKTMPFNAKTTLAVGYFNDLHKAGQAVLQLQKLNPSALEIVDYHLLAFLKENKPETIEGLIPEQLPSIVLLAEFDDVSLVKQTWKMMQAQRIMKKLGYDCRVASGPAEQERLWRIRRSAAAVIWMNHGPKKALPIIEDGCVPVEKLPEFLEKTYKLLGKNKLSIAVWGHAGNAHLHMQPFMDLSKASERKKVLKVADQFFDMVIKMGGTTCGEHNDGLARAPYLKKLYGAETYDLFKEVKAIFDPQNIMNPLVKLDVTTEMTSKLLRHEYGMKHLYDHMPHN